MRTSSAVGTLFVATVLCYSPLLGGGFEFLSWDDTTNIVHHPIVNTWSREHLLAAWSSIALGVYEPLGVLLNRPGTLLSVQLSAVPRPTGVSRNTSRATEGTAED